MKEQLKLVSQIHKEKSSSMNKTLEQWFINKSSSFASYYRSQEGLIKLISSAYNNKRQKFQVLSLKLKELVTSNGSLQRKSSLKKLISTLTKNDNKSLALQYLQRMNNSFQRQTNDYLKSLNKNLTNLKSLQKDRLQVCQKQNTHLRKVLIDGMKKPVSLKQIYILSNIVLREAQKFVKLIRQFKELVKKSSEKEQEILNSLLDNLNNCVKEFPQFVEELGLIIKQAEKLLKTKEIDICDITIIDPTQKTQLLIKSDQLSIFLSTSQQQIIWTSNVQGLQASLLNQMSTRVWNNICLMKQNMKTNSNTFKVIITTDGYLLIVDKYKLVEYELKLNKVQAKILQNKTVNVSKENTGLMKLIGLQNICNLGFQTQEQCQEFMLHTKKFRGLIG